MSAAVCGNKRSFFEDLPPSPQLPKRLRCSSSTSPIRFPAPTLIDQLRAVFPHMEDQVLERALQDCGNDINAAIKSLHGLCLGSTHQNSGTAEEPEAHVETGTLEDKRDASASGNQSASINLPADGAEWIHLFVREMMSASSVDNARARAARLLEGLEESISSHASAGATNVLQKENFMLKQQIEVLAKEKSSFRSAFRIQLERLSDYENKNRELQQLKQMLSQYREQIRALEVNNYALRMHLNQAQQCHSFPGRVPPDAF